MKISKYIFNESLKRIVYKKVFYISIVVMILVEILLFLIVFLCTHKNIVISITLMSIIQVINVCYINIYGFNQMFYDDKENGYIAFEKRSMINWKQIFFPRIAAIKLISFSAIMLFIIIWFIFGIGVNVFESSMYYINFGIGLFSLFLLDIFISCLCLIFLIFNLKKLSIAICTIIGGIMTINWMQSTLLLSIRSIKNDEKPIYFPERYYFDKIWYSEIYENEILASVGNEFLKGIRNEFVFQYQLHYINEYCDLDELDGSENSIVYKFFESCKNIYLNQKLEMGNYNDSSLNLLSYKNYTGKGQLHDFIIFLNVNAKLISDDTKISQYWIKSISNYINDYYKNFIVFYASDDAHQNKNPINNNLSYGQEFFFRLLLYGIIFMNVKSIVDYETNDTYVSIYNDFKSNFRQSAIQWIYDNLTIFGQMYKFEYYTNSDFDLINSVKISNLIHNNFAIGYNLPIYVDFKINSKNQQLSFLTKSYTWVTYIILILYDIIFMVVNIMLWKKREY